MEIAVVGNSDFAIGFRLAGIRKHMMLTSSDIESKIQSVLSDKT